MSVVAVRIVGRGQSLPEPLRDEIPSIEDLQGVVEKLRGDLKERKDKPGTSFSDPEDE